VSERNVFDVIRSIEQDRKSKWDGEMENLYNPFIINKAFSFHLDSLFLANELNRMHDLPKKWQHDFLFHSLRKYKRPFVGSWPKPAKNMESLEMVKEYFGFSTQKAFQALKVLTPESLEKIRKEMDKGGIDAKQKREKPK
jgi:hypothetical protein